MHEDVAMMMVNPRASSNRVDPFIVFRLGDHAVASAVYWPGTRGLPGSASVSVTYSDPPGEGSSKPIKISVGQFSEENTDLMAFHEERDQLKELMASYPEKWAEFIAKLAEAFVAVSVLEA